MRAGDVRRMNNEPRLSPLREVHIRLIGAAVFLATALAAALLVWGMEQRREQAQRAHIESLVADRAHAIEATVEQTLSSTYALSAMVHQAGGEFSNFQGVADEMLRLYPGASILGLSPGGVIRHVAPLAGNERSIGFNQLKDPVQGKESQLALKTRMLTLAGPLNLVQGGLGVVGRLPIFLSDIPEPERSDNQPGFWGFAYVVIRLPQALAGSGIAQLTEQQLAYALWRVHPDTGERQTIAASNPQLLSNPTNRTINVPNGQWVLSVSPEAGWGDPFGLALEAALGLLFSGLLAAASQLLLHLKRQERNLEAVVVARTREIYAAQYKLEATLDAIPDLLFELGPDSTIHDFRAPATLSLDIPLAQCIDRTIPQVLPANAAEVVTAALAAAAQHGRSEGGQFGLPGTQGPQWFEISLARKGQADGMEPRFIMLARNITQSKAAEEEIKQLAYYDPLTHLPNRRLLLERLGQVLAMNARNGDFGALQFIDLDNFKTLNDTLGHDMGDLLLQQVAARLGDCVRASDTVARLGGDEFVILLAQLSTQREEAAADAETIAEKVRQAITQPYRLVTHEYELSASVGITLFQGVQDSIEDLLKQADLAMYQSKSAGRNTLRFYDPKMQAVVSARVAMEADIRRGLAQQQFQLYFQLQVDTEGQAVGAEVLMRWFHPVLGMVGPNKFIPVAEDTGLILPLGHWVLHAACIQLKNWSQQARTQHLTLAVNVSARQFRQPDFVASVIKILKDTAAPAHRLKLELTESMLVNDMEDTITKMHALKDLGLGFALDDFGTGYSSLSYLKRLPLDQLKIDRSFVNDLMTDPNDAVIAQTVITLGHSLGLAVIAEGVETAAQQDFLAHAGCDTYQGYLFGRPVPLLVFEQTLGIRTGDTRPAPLTA